MVNRFRTKGQVSRYDRFGYGVMLAQVCATLPGAASLHRAGLLYTLLKVGLVLLRHEN